MRTAYLDQIYDPGRARKAAAFASDGNFDGINSIDVLKSGYQGDIASHRAFVLSMASEDGEDGSGSEGGLVGS